MPSFIIVEYMWPILRRRDYFCSIHLWAAPKRPILNKVKEEPFSIVQPATEYDTNSLEQVTSRFEVFPNIDCMNDAKKVTQNAWFFPEVLYIENIFLQATILTVYTISHCTEATPLTFFLIQYLLKLMVCCITNPEIIHTKRFCCQFWRMFRNLPTINALLTNRINSEEH